MPPTETQVLTWLYSNWPSVLLGLSVALIYVSAWSRLNTFLARIEKSEKATVKQAQELVQVKVKIAQLCLIHCKKYGDDLDKLMKIEEEPPNDD